MALQLHACCTVSDCSKRLKATLSATPGADSLHPAHMDRAVPPPELLDQPETAAGWYMRQVCPSVIKPHTCMHAPHFVSKAGARSQVVHATLQHGIHQQLLTGLRQAGGLGPGAGGRPPSLVVRYAACGGLFNQHYCHVAGIAMAIALGADGVVSSMRPGIPQCQSQGAEVRPTCHDVQRNWDRMNRTKASELPHVRM